MFRAITRGSYGRTISRIIVNSHRRVSRRIYANLGWEMRAREREGRGQRERERGTRETSGFGLSVSRAGPPNFSFATFKKKREKKKKKGKKKCKKNTDTAECPKRNENSRGAIAPAERALLHTVLILKLLKKKQKTKKLKKTTRSQFLIKIARTCIGVFYIFA